MVRTGGPAFPAAAVGSGMTLRDYFAGQALTALVATRSQLAGLTLTDYDELAKEAYEVADAMLQHQ